MARKLIQYYEITDDFDKTSKADDTIELGIDGDVYELDLTAVHAKELRDFLAPYQDAAHDRWKMPPRKKAKKRSVPPMLVHEPTPITPPGITATKLRDRAARTEIRHWLQKEGYDVPDTGMIRAEYLAAYQEANPDAYIPASTLLKAGLTHG